MDSPYLPAITAIKVQIAAKDAELTPLREQLAAKEAELNPLKVTANELCKLAGLPAEYVIGAPGSGSAPAAAQASRIAIRPDQFFNKELGEAVVEYLTMKKTSDAPAPASVDEIFTALVSGGYKFNGSSDATNKNALKTSLTRNTAQMAKISDDLYGLRKWYGMRAARRSGGGDEGSDTADSTPSATPKAPAADVPGA